jgi:hypothetical protein
MSEQLPYETAHDHNQDFNHYRSSIQDNVRFNSHIDIDFNHFQNRDHHCNSHNDKSKQYNHFHNFFVADEFSNPSATVAAGSVYVP